MKYDFDTIRIYFGETLHLFLKRREVVAVQSWREDDKYFAIEVTFRDGATVMTEYNDEKKFTTIMGFLNDNL